MAEENREKPKTENEVKPTQAPSAETGTSYVEIKPSPTPTPDPNYVEAKPETTSAPTPQPTETPEPTQEAKPTGPPQPTPAVQERYEYQSVSEPVASSGRSWGKVVLGIIVVIIIIAAAGFAFSGSPEITGNIIGTEGNESQNENLESEQVFRKGDVVVTMEEVNEIYGQIPEELRAEITIENITEVLFREKFLLRQAEIEGIEVTTEEVENLITTSLEFSGQTIEEFKTELENSGTSYNEFIEDYKKQLIISEVIAANVNVTDIIVTEEEIDEFIENDIYFSQYENETEETQELYREQARAEIEREKQMVLIEEYIATLIPE